VSTARGPVVRGVLEACLYAADLAAAERFYAEVVGLPVFARVPTRHVFFRCGSTMFLVFDPTATARGMRTDASGSRLEHGALGPGHVAFEVSVSSIGAWRDKLAQHGVAIEADVNWPGGGRSLYVRDPAGNSVELATKAVWSEP